MGFSQGKSTVGALLTVINNWHQSLEAKMDVCAVLFNLKKAFDSVPHRPLLLKLSSLGIDLYLVKWIASYLCAEELQEPQEPREPEEPEEPQEPGEPKEPGEPEEPQELGEP